MNIKKIYKKHLRLNKKNKYVAIGESIKDINNIIDKSDVDGKFMKDYYRAKRHSIILSIISPGIIFGISTGAIVSVIDFATKITNIATFITFLLQIISIVIPSATFIYFVPIRMYGHPVKSVLLPHQIRRMEMRIDKQYESIDNNKRTIVVKIKKIKCKRKKYSIH